MKKAYLVLISTLIISAISAQPVGNTWHYSYSNLMAYGYLKLEHVTDSTIGGKSYMKLEKEYYLYVYPGHFDTTHISPDFLRWETDSVFRFIDGEDKLLFAFNMQPGDSILLLMGNNFGSASCDSLNYAVVDSIGSIQIGSLNKRWIAVTQTADSDLAYSGKIIEGVGPVEHYFFPEYYNCLADANEGGPFRCISQDDSLVFQALGAQACDYIMSLPEASLTLNIHPNPASHEIILPNELDCKTYHIYSSSGKLMLYGNNEAQSCIDISMLSPGLYIIVTAGNRTLREKFVKE